MIGFTARATPANDSAPPVSYDSVLVGAEDRERAVGGWRRLPPPKVDPNELEVGGRRGGSRGRKREEEGGRGDEVER